MDLFRFFKRESDSTSCEKEKEKAKAGAKVRVNRVLAGAESSMQCSAFYRAICLRASTASRARLRMLYLNPRTGVWDENVRDVIYAEEYRHLNWLLSVKPNRYMTAKQMWQRVHMLRDIDGESGIYMTRTGRNVEEMYPVRIVYNQMSDTYTCTCDEIAMTWQSVPSNDVLVLKGPVYGYEYGRGRSLWSAASNSISLDLTAEAFSAEVMSKGGTFKAIVKQESTADPLAQMRNFNDQEVKSNVDSLEEQLNAGKDLVYDASAVQLFQIQQSFQDLQVTVIRTQCTELIARFCGVPLPLMFCSTNAVYKSIDDAFHTFLELTIRPLLEDVEEQINTKILGEREFGKLRFAFDTSMLCLDSENIKAQAASTRRNSGVTTANEERIILGLPPHEGGDELVTKVSGNAQQQDPLNTNQKGGTE